MKQHLGHLKERYGTPVVLANLIDQKGNEGILARAFSMHIRDINDSDLHYIPWDFHHHCRSLQWHNVSLLMDEMTDDLERIKFFSASKFPNWAIESEQHGIVRTNCVDCLDRTNVVQSVIARRSLLQVLHKWSLTPSPDNMPLTLDIVFKNIWADNADAISRQYSGTGALKTDYTRTGIRTYKGAAWDCINSISRYLRGNFTDAFRQDAMDLFFGYFLVDPSDRISPFGTPHYSSLLKYLPITLAILVSFLLIQTILTWKSSLPLHPIVMSLIYFILLYGLRLFIKRHGVHFVEYPRLRPPPIAISRSVHTPAHQRPMPDLRNKAHLI